ncbi:MAG: heme-binding protein [Granulosicoccus sp.]|nr:heme-binding protein [Granulosicoccus sp.]
MKARFLIILLFLQTAGQLHADEDVLVVDTKRMTLATALQVAQATIASCTAKGIQIGVTVVDREGNVQVALRDTIAAPITIPISRKKAFTSANFNSSTTALAERADTPVGRQEMLLMSAGALPIEVGGSLLGAVGVSGAPSGATDEECAQAGVDAVIDELELSIDG